MPQKHMSAPRPEVVIPLCIRELQTLDGLELWAGCLV